MLNSIERFRTIVNQPFLDRGTVRRGGLSGDILEFVKFAYDPPASLRQVLRVGRKTMLLYIFRFEATATPEAHCYRRDSLFVQPRQPLGQARLPPD